MLDPDHFVIRQLGATLQQVDMELTQTRALLADTERRLAELQPEPEAEAEPKPASPETCEKD